ncbi:S-adenosyl-L-methionine-dependent methyltransferase [Thelephora ganbajun]|uniref:S-adenosyl-L-methionine-dependent methyltransferase n=1 Tax=Thelephora ganbajun TaxID=370292 RepID=A0ACB6Z7J8_THEGA|nr:S-adenosyl-L-methionine-dependent methyltransferase [Thelephora ganbajun]
MAKGKSRSNFTGVSRFLDALKTDAGSASPSQISDSTIKETDDSDDRQAKKRKTDTPKLLPSDSAYQSYDATGVVPFYTKSSQVPEDLMKYFSQRRRYFSLYDQGCLLDRVGWYSVTPELIANQIAERCRCDTIVDAFCGVGGNAIAFAQTCEHVIAIDNDETRLRLARHNAAIYGVADRIEFVLDDFIQFAKTLVRRSETRKGGRAVDVIFLSPPWGGPSYLHGTSPNTPPDASQYPEFRLSDITPIHGSELFKLAERATPNIAYYLPRNTNLQEISDLVTTTEEGGAKGKGKARMVEVEEEWMGEKLKALTCYFGGLAQGQEDLF